jgi:hypothetical protein
MSDERRELSETSTEHLQQHLLNLILEVISMRSSLDYVTILLKQGVPEDQVLAANNLWRRMGLTHILLGARTYQLREVETS